MPYSLAELFCVSLLYFQNCRKPSLDITSHLHTYGYTLHITYLIASHWMSVHISCG